jgi:hypothetical protein
MDERNAWDDHTEQIVSSRLNLNPAYQFLSAQEGLILKSICSVLMEDDRKDVVQFVLYHIDETLHSSIGESQRKIDVPEASILIRAGLRGIDEYTQFAKGTTFIKLNSTDQKELLMRVSRAEVMQVNVWSSKMQKSFFEKILSLVVEAYCSHPLIWSEMGYAGPAYPRGYVRADIGHLDPWEAQPE